MSGVTLGTVALATLAGAAVVGTGYSIYSGEQQRKAQSNALDQQRDAQNKAEANALKQEKAAEETQNKALAKRPDTTAIMSQAEQAGKNGVGGTILTGAAGVDPNSLQLEKKSLLGG